MAYIYKIINDINDKIYIGKTVLSIEKRFKEHCNEYSKRRVENRPLYRAMYKYGIEHFKIEQVEECLNEEANEREIYWIKYYNSYYNGYNATLGGDGTSYIDYDLVYQKFQEGYSITDISKEINRDVGHLADILKSMGVSQQEIWNNSHKKMEKELVMLDKKTGEELKHFQSVAKAAKYIIDNRLSKDTVSGVSSHICQCCNGIRKTAYQYKWKYIGV